MTDRSARRFYFDNDSVGWGQSGLGFLDGNSQSENYSQSGVATRELWDAANSDPRKTSGIREVKSGFTDPYVVLCLVIAALSGLTPYFVDITAPQSGEYDAAMALSISADVIATVQVLVNWWRTPTPTETLPMPGVLTLPTMVILRIYAAVEILEFTVGFGPPYEGHDFKVGSKQLTALREQLESTFPDSSWQGSAAQAYVAEVAALRDGVQELAELDRKLAARLKDQADWVNHMRLGFGILKLLLTIAAAATTRPMTVSGFGGLAWVARAAAVCAGLAIAMASGMVATLLVLSVDRVKKIDRLRRDYGDVSGR